MRGAIIGLTMDVTLDNLALTYYAAVEFLAQQTRHIITSLNGSGHTISSVFLSGGQCRNPLLVQLIANATRLLVVKPHYEDHAVVIGAAMMGAKAATADGFGRTENLWTIMNRMSKPGTVIHPTNEEQELRLLEAKYQVFLKMIESQQEYKRIVDAAICLSDSVKDGVENEAGDGNGDEGTDKDMSDVE